MSTRTRPARHATTALTTVLVVGLLALTGCGSADPDNGGDATPTVSESQPNTSDGGSGSDSGSSSDAKSRAVTVTFHKTGGLRPTDLTLSYSANGQPPQGATAADVDRVLAAASDPALRDLKMANVPKYPCCDLQEYTVVISYADGSTESFRTVDGLQQPAVFEHLVSLLG